MRTVLRCVAAAGVLATVAGCARLAPEPNFSGMSFRDRPFSFRHNMELFEVTNGMRVVLIRDATTNIATVDLRYDVGAAEDPEGRIGMAHLVEHVAFGFRARPGGPTLGDELAQLALSWNAATSWDYTHYTATLPVQNLEQVIALEGRRMRAPCEQLDEASFRREVEVVLNEERQRHVAGQRAQLEVIAEVFGVDHAYRRPLSAPEIAGATLAELCTFMQQHYAPDRAYLVVTGNFDPARMRAHVGRTFGPITRIAGPRAPVAPATLNGRVSRHLAPLERPKVMVLLPYPRWGGDDEVLWDVVRAQLGAALSSADDKHRWITDTAVYPWFTDRERVLVATVEVQDASFVERAAEEVFARAAALDAEQSPRAQRRLVAAWSLAYVNTWDQRATRGEWISQFMQYTLHNAFMLQELRSLHSAELGTKLREIARKLDRAHSHVAYLMPSGERERPGESAVSATTHDLVPWRVPVDPADADRPVPIATAAPARRLVEFELDNGLRVVLAPDRDSQVVDARVTFPVGRAHAPADQPSLASAAAELLWLDEDGKHQGGTLTRLAWALGRGTVQDTQVDATSTTFIARGSALWSDWHVWFLSWLLDQGTYSARTVRAAHRTATQQVEDEADDDDDDDAGAAIDRVVGERLYGAGHPYATPSAGAAAMLRVEVDDLKRWKSQWYRARGATLIVSGGFDADKMREQIEEHFGSWNDDAPPALPPIATPRPADTPSWFAVHDSGASQTRVRIAAPTRSDRKRDEAARRVLVAMLEDELRDIREGMGATYGVQVGYSGGALGGALHVFADVDEARSVDAIERIIAIVDRLASDGAAQRESFVRARKRVLASALARTSGATAVAEELWRSLHDGHGTGHAQALAQQIAALTPEVLARVAAADLGAQRRVVLINGKPAVVGAVFERLGAKPEVLDGGAEEPDVPREPAEPGEPAEPAEPTPRDPGQLGDDEEPPEPPRETRASEDELFLGSESARPGHKAGSFYLGSKQISLDEFLRLGGADDVRKRMQKRKTIRRTLLVGAAIGVVGGGGYALTARFCDAADFTVQSEFDACRESQNRRRLVGAIAAGAGVVLGLVRMQIGDGTPSEEELSDIAARYNRISVTPTALPGGGGVMISGGF